MGRQLAVTDRTDLSFYEGWEGCYVEWRPATYVEAKALLRAELAGLDDDVAEQMGVDIIKKRLVSGKVKVQSDDDGVELVDVEADDIDAMPSLMIDRILADMMGVAYDADPLEETQKDATSSENESTAPDTASTPSNEPTPPTTPTATE